MTPDPAGAENLEPPTDPIDLHAACPPAVELARLKARRCDGCAWGGPAERPSTLIHCHAWGIVALRDHACNDWQPREDQP